METSINVNKSHNVSPSTSNLKTAQKRHIKTNVMDDLDKYNVNLQDTQDNLNTLKNISVNTDPHEFNHTNTHYHYYHHHNHRLDTTNPSNTYFFL